MYYFQDLYTLNAMTTSKTITAQPKWELVLGFEIHAELATKSKMFCACPADHFGQEPNTQTCPVCLGLPGALPVPNAKAIEWCIKLGQALNCSINLESKFDRKNYFYPDLPKGYQISQYDKPFCHDGYLDLASGRRIRITRVHMEEDTAKLQHSQIDGQKVSLIDFNRSGVPLVEIVTEPDFKTTSESDEFLKEVQLIIRALDISTADMEKGSMRLEANISVRPVGKKDLPEFKVEVKNVNSFRFIKKAIEFEFNRQVELLEQGQIPSQETRGYDESRGVTFSQRSKEQAHDYRYFPEPDIPPFKFFKDQINQWKQELPILPAQIRSQLVASQLSSDSASTLIASPVRLKRYYELIKKGLDPKKAASLVINTPEDKVATIDATQTNPTTDVSQILPLVEKIVSENPKAVSDFKAGKTQSLFFLVGMVKRQLPQADANQVRDLITSKISG